MDLASALRLAPGQRIVEPGCGAGAFALSLLPAISPGGSITGFDLDETQVACARRRALEAGARRALRAEQGDACDLASVPSASFDRAVCRKLLIHISYPLRALREMARIVRSGGLVAAIEPDELAARLSWRDSGSDLDPGLVPLRAEVHGRIAAGALAAGGGDRRLGPRLPDLMLEAGLVQPTLSLDHCLLRLPGQAGAEEVLRHLDDAHRCEVEQDLYLAAGGSHELWLEWQRREALAAGLRAEQARRGTLRATVSEMLYVCVAEVSSAA